MGQLLLEKPWARATNTNSNGSHMICKRLILYVITQTCPRHAHATRNLPSARALELKSLILAFGEDCGPTLIGKAMGTRNKYKLKWFTHDMQTLDFIRYYSNLPSARPRNKKPALGTPTPTLLCNGGRLHKNKRSMSARPSM